MPNCSVFCCDKRSGTSNLQKDGVTFHIFPKNPVLRNIWKEFCNNKRTWDPKRTSVICSTHFERFDYKNLANNRRKLVENAIPKLIPNCICTSHPLPMKPSCNTVGGNTSATPILLTSLGESYHQQPQQQQIQALPIESSCKTVGANVSATPQLLSSLGESSHQQPQQQQIMSTVSSEKCVPKSMPLSELLTPRKRKMQYQIDHQKKKIKRLQAKNRYLKKKVASLEEILQTLDEKSLIDKEEKMILETIGVEEKELIQRQQTKSESGKLSRAKYSAELRCFALTLNFYSPKAYKFVRKTFGTCLPHPRTLTKWYSNIDGRPGFTKEALTALKYKAEANPDKKIYCTLVFDEMKIMCNPESPPNSNRQFGRVDYGFDLVTDNSVEATDVMVFLLVGINTSWKVPIGFFLVKGTSAKLKAQLVTKAFELVHETGIQIKALTCDGTRPNLAMATELGCCLDPSKLQTTILDPTTGQRVYFFLDPSHMLKLIRNTFSDYKCFYDIDRNKIDWQFIETLNKMQEEELFFMANKLRTNHIYFKSKIMNVRLAAQLFSASVADALIFCETKLNLPEFHGSSATANFLLLINDVFDILDSRSRQHRFKRALNKDNVGKAFQRMAEAQKVLMNLSAYVKKRNGEISKMNLLNSPRFTGFLGFLICIESAKSIFQDLVQDTENGLQYMPLHRVSQDHLELFFSNVRSHGGHCDNPTPRQFESIYKKLLVNTQLIQTGSGTNCIPLEKITILNCTSAIQKINTSSVREYSNDDTDEVNFQNVVDDLMDEIEMQTFLSPFGEKVVEYIAGFIVYSISKKIKCNTCIKGLLGPVDENSLIHQKSRGNLQHASKEVINLCRVCEKEIRQRLGEDNRPTLTCTTNQIVLKVLRKFIGKDLFPFISYHSYENDFTDHNLELARLILEKYSDTRISFLMKKSNPEKCVRQIYTKLIHFKNQ